MSSHLLATFNRPRRPRPVIGARRHLAAAALRADNAAQAPRCHRSAAGLSGRAQKPPAPPRLRGKRASRATGRGDAELHILAASAAATFRLRAPKSRPISARASYRRNRLRAATLFSAFGFARAPSRAGPSSFSRLGNARLESSLLESAGGKLAWPRRLAERLGEAALRCTAAPRCAALRCVALDCVRAPREKEPLLCAPPHCTHTHTHTRRAINARAPHAPAAPPPSI